MSLVLILFLVLVLLFLSKFNNSIPNYLKYSFRLILCFYAIMKFLGYNFIGLIQNLNQVMHIYMILVVYVILSELFFLVYIFFLYKYEKLNLLEIFPDFFIKKINKDKEKYYNNKYLFEIEKRDVFIHITIYSIILIFAIFALIK